MTRIILASNSPRRKEILQNLGLKFQVISPDIQEKADQNAANVMVENLALQKATAVFETLKQQGENLDDTLIIAADTVVEDIYLSLKYLL
ncbi:MAG: Maf family protein, partial [Clostridia bacterium]|nr:Maf family protein [Clostridia bacterium]